MRRKKKEVQHPTPPDRILNRILNNRYYFIFPCLRQVYYSYTLNPEGRACNFQTLAGAQDMAVG